MDKQLSWITSILQINNIKYWVDQGTLLGLIRDGKLIDHDKDIDLSIWDEDIDKLEKIIPDIKREGYRLRILQYKNYKFKYKFIPQNSNDLRKLDINIYYRVKDLFAWSPQPYTIDGNSFFYKVVKKIILFYWTRIATKVKIDKIPWSIISKTLTWWIPAMHFEQIIFHERNKVFIPKNYKEHLKLHFGNWKLPAKKWDFIHDDKALKHTKPAILIKVLR